MSSINKTAIISIWLFISFFLIGCRTGTEKASQADMLGCDMGSAESHEFFIKKCRECQNYDWNILTNILDNCNDLVDRNKAFIKKRIEIAATFDLQRDGSISDLKISGDTNSFIAPFLAQAITNCAPFPKWPDQMRSIVKRNHREMKFRLFSTLGLTNIPS
ncbi:MAG: hypothetical protein ACREFE_09530 [Limisphaerales bacterium]